MCGNKKEEALKRNENIKKKFKSKYKGFFSEFGGKFKSGVLLTNQLLQI